MSSRAGETNEGAETETGPLGHWVVTICAYPIFSPGRIEEGTLGTKSERRGSSEFRTLS